jgi:hypothetical protein
MRQHQVLRLVNYESQEVIAMDDLDDDQVYATAKISSEDAVHDLSQSGTLNLPPLVRFDRPFSLSI